MTDINIIVYDFGVKGVTSSRDVQVAKTIDTNVVLTFALCDQSGKPIVLAVPTENSIIEQCFQLTDYYSGSTSIAGFTINTPGISSTTFNSFTVKWVVTCTDSSVRQTFGYIIDTQGWTSQGRGQAYNLSMKGAQNAFSLYATTV
ncbi:hypothetical protein HGG72_02115 [Ochrobactrum pecoris]|uniref:Uncharacterized protein n=1 Tax=Brucella pecoris TaxID=867683 RepID=A0A5C5CNG0_9HYPH|nr:hypothetical protein [Brucella pecoris]MBB4093905.1 hypothetical protein [Brucella pecoris]NKW79391.1 hypothetical protein [Brucella pecoris]TNV12724.1 hypothetical protein FIB18_09250 [Brucella pecoris]